MAIGLALAALVVVGFRSGELEYDDAHYVARGFYHAHQVGNGAMGAVRLPWSLMFEAPKPPLFVGWLALGALAIGDRQPGAVVAWGTLLPWASLLGIAGLAAGRKGGAGASFYALALLAVAGPLVACASRPLVEISLATWVLATIWLLEERRARASGWLDAGAGVGIGLALATKATAVLFVAMPVVWLLVDLRRRSGIGPALATGARVLAAVVLIAGPWYLRNGEAALDFARYGATFGPCRDVGANWTRPARLLLGAFGWTGAAAYAGAFWWGRDGRPRLDGGWARFAVLSAMPAGIAIALPPVFEPRYFLPAIGPIAISAALRLGARDSSASRGGRMVVRATALIAAIATLASLARADKSPGPWAAGEALRGLATHRSSAFVLCTLGSAPNWNEFRLEAVVERERLHDRISVRNLLDAGAWSATASGAIGCDWIVELDPSSVPRESSQVRFNRDLELATRRLRASGEWRSCEACAADLKSAAPLAVLERSSG